MKRSGTCTVVFVHGVFIATANDKWFPPNAGTIRLSVNNDACTDYPHPGAAGDPYSVWDGERQRTTSGQFAIAEHVKLSDAEALNLVGPLRIVLSGSPPVGPLIYWCAEGRD